MTLYTQLKEFPVATQAEITAPSTDGIYVNIDGVDRFLPFSEMPGSTGLESRVEVLEEGSTVITPEQYAAVGDGVADDTVALQAAIDAVTLARGGTVEFKQGSAYKVTSLNIPKTFTNRSLLRIRGNGARLIGSGANTILKRIPVDNTEALGTMVDLNVIVDDVVFQGDGATVNQNGVDIGATYASAFRGCHFYNLYRNLDLKFCLDARIESCRISNSRKAGFSVSIGDWTGADYSNSASNSSMFTNCRVYTATGADHCYYIGGSSGVVLDTCIAEGGNPTDNVKFDALSSTNVKDFRILNLHSENTPTNSVVRLIANGGRILIDGIYHQAINAILVDDTGAVGSALIDLHIPYFSAGSKLRNGGSYWIMRYMGALGQEDMSSATKWDGALPAAWTHYRLTTGSPIPELQGNAFKIGPNVFLGGKLYDRNGLQLLDVRQTGLANITGVAGLTAFDTETATTLQVARRLKVIDDVLKAHGLTGV